MYMYIHVYVYVYVHVYVYVYVYVNVYVCVFSVWQNGQVNHGTDRVSGCAQPGHEFHEIHKIPLSQLSICHVVDLYDMSYIPKIYYAFVQHIVIADRCKSMQINANSCKSKQITAKLQIYPDAANRCKTDSIK